MAIAIETYFQKIVDPKDISSTAVVIPALFSLIWLYSSSVVYLLEAGMVLISLLLAANVPGCLGAIILPAGQ